MQTLRDLWSAAHILIPLALGVLLLLRVVQVRLRDGVRPWEVPFDRVFLMSVFYTGALLAIYLSCIHFYRLAMNRGGV